MKGVRGPLLLVSVGLLLSTIWGLPAMIGSAGVAGGMFDLRQCESARRFGRWRLVAVIAGFCTSLLWLAFLAYHPLLVLEPIAETLALLSATIVLGRLATTVGAESLRFALRVAVCAAPICLVLFTFKLLLAAAIARGLTYLLLAAIAFWIRARTSQPGQQEARHA